MLYSEPGMEILKIEATNVICASVNGTHDGNNPGGDISNAGDSWLPPIEE